MEDRQERGPRELVRVERRLKPGTKATRQFKAHISGGENSPWLPRQIDALRFYYNSR